MWKAALAGVLLAGAAAVPVVLTTTGSVANAAATSGGVKIAYFDQWSIYQNAFYLKNLDTEGIASKLNYLIYDFENIDPDEPDLLRDDEGDRSRSGRRERPERR